jgi:hypothetical protein
MDDRDREACIAGIFLHLQYLSYLETSERLGPFPTKIGQGQRRTVAQPVAIFPNNRDQLERRMATTTDLLRTL